MASKVTIREIDGTEYQLKKRIAEMILKAGYSRKVERGLHQMLSVPLAKALRLIDTDGMPVYAYGAPYIPTKLPPREVHGVYFNPPANANDTTHKVILQLAHLGVPGFAEFA